MNTRENYFISISLILLTWVLCLNIAVSQTLYDDTQSFLKATNTLQHKATASPDSLIQATADLLTILNTYYTSVHGDTVLIKNWEEIKLAYLANPQLKDQLHDSLFQLPEPIINSAISLAEKQIETRNQQPRNKIIQLLQAEKAVSPADYLSIKNTLKKYQTPPNTQAIASRIVATKSNKNVNNSGLLTSEVAFIQGLFKVILNGASKEVVISYLEKLVNKDTPNLLKLFPTVAEEFANAEVNYSNSFIDRLRQTFYEDLQTMSIRLPLLMLEDEYFKPLQSDPLAYNLLALYTIVGMGQNEVPIEESLPVTHRFLYQSYLDADKELNLDLAKNAYSTKTYQGLTLKVESFKTQLKKIALAYDDIENRTLDRIEDNLDDFPDAKEEPYIEDYLKSEFDLEGLLNGDQNKYDLFLLPSLLSGEFDPSIIQYNTLEFYDKFFGQEFSPTQKRAAGLDLTRKLNGTWYNEQTIIDLIRDWQVGLMNYERAVDNWVLSLDEGAVLAQAIQQVELGRITLAEKIKAEKVYWQDSLNTNEKLAFDLLENISNNFKIINNSVGKDAVEKLELKQQQIASIEQRVIQLKQQLFQKYDGFFTLSPFSEYLKNKEEKDSYGSLKQEINILETTLNEIDGLVKKLDKESSLILSKKKNNAIPFLQTTELFSKLLYGLRSDNIDDKWLDINQLNVLFDGEKKEEISLGLLQQSISSVKNIGYFSPEILAQFTQVTLRELNSLRFSKDTIGARSDSLRFFRVASFAINTLNRILELPMIQDKDAVKGFTPLKEQYPSLNNVPDLSRKVLDFVYYLNIKEHNHAISTLLRIFSGMDARVNKLDGNQKGKEEKRTDAIFYLQRYGNFIADLIDAENKEQIEDLLVGITAPPGSSRIKRRRPLTVGINAYVGGTVGWESWRSSVLPEEDNFFNFSPTMPIGLTISGKIGKKKKHSISAFISFIDLGGLFAYRADANAVGESQFNFKNMIKPGLQLHYNFPKSPFYLGLGAQYGPQQRRVNDKETTLNSIRYFVGFGIDVPLLSLYQKFEKKKG